MLSGSHVTAAWGYEGDFYAWNLNSGPSSRSAYTQFAGNMPILSLGGLHNLTKIIHKGASFWQQNQRVWLLAWYTWLLPEAKKRIISLPSLPGSTFHAFISPLSMTFRRIFLDASSISQLSLSSIAMNQAFAICLKAILASLWLTHFCRNDSIGYLANLSPEGLKREKSDLRAWLRMNYIISLPQQKA